MAKLTKVQRTENLLSKEADKAGGFDKLNRKSILKTMRSRMGMSQVMASTYYHNALTKLAH